MTILSMMQRKRLNIFYTIAIAEGGLNLTEYKDPTFAKDMKILALERIDYLLFTIHSQQLRAETEPASFRLEDLINTPDPTTRCTILDYCVMAGLHELSLRIAVLGGKTSIKIDKLCDSILAEFTGERPEIINDIIEATKQIKSDSANLSKHLAAKKQSPWKRFTNFILGPHKYAILLFIGGIAAIVAAPFTGGLSAVIMTSVGIPAVLASIPAYQKGTATKNATFLINEKIRVYYEVTELNAIINDVKNAKLDLTLQTSNLCEKHVITSPRLTSKTLDDPIDILLFSHHENTEHSKPQNVELRRALSIA